MQSEFCDWSGRQEQRIDIFEPTRTNALSAALGDGAQRVEGSELPLLHHWLYFWDVRPPEGLGADGHPARGGFLPPVPLPRRMWAGGRLEFIRPLLVGEKATRTSTILKIESKSGRSGDLVFVTVQHEIAGEAGVAVREEQDIVYRGAAAAGSVTAPIGGSEAPSASWRRDILPDAILLFRYSALTMNGHRIHYDRTYAVAEEAYPALVVHGPLQATLMAELAQRSLQAPLTGFKYRGQAPAFDGAMLHVCGEPTAAGGQLRTEQNGGKKMVATATVMAPSEERPMPFGVSSGKAAP